MSPRVPGSEVPGRKGTVPETPADAAANTGLTERGRLAARSLRRAGGAARGDACPTPCAGPARLPDKGGKGTIGWHSRRERS